MGSKKSKQTADGRDVITLADLAPRLDVMGGSGRQVFGADATEVGQEEGNMASKKVSKTKDLKVKSGSKVRGGRTGWSSNENLTLVRAAEPRVKKDLTPKSSGKVSGGGRYLNENLTLVRAAKPKVKKDLSPKTSGKVKGGRPGWTSNENLTLVRAVKPEVKKDLPPKKNPKGGRHDKTT